MTENLQTALNYLIHFLKAKHRRGHGVHSPRIFEFVSEVLFDKKKYDAYSFLLSIRDGLKHSPIAIAIEEAGAGSKKFKNDTRSIGEMLRTSSVRPKYAKLLYRIAQHYSPKTIIELGTSIGFSALCLAQGNSESRVISIEANKSLCNFARELFRANAIKNADILDGYFDSLLSEIEKKYPPPELVYIDGNHDYLPTLRYFNHFANYMKTGIILFDDINWSANMRKAWKKIIADKRTVVSLDLFQMGIVFLDRTITPGHYIIKF